MLKRIVTNMMMVTAACTLGMSSFGMQSGEAATNHATVNPPNIEAQSAVVMDMATGDVVYAKNPLTTHYPASITKVLTAMIALQRGHLKDRLVTSKLATEQEPSSVNLVVNEQEPLEKILYGLLLHSGNDAAVVIAEHYGKSVKGFAQMMNDEARKLGADHSHFDNPNGLPDPAHVTCAYDMAVITRAAMQIPEFRKIVATKYYNWHGETWSARLRNLNRMLFTYPGAIGVKTGYTDAAHHTLIVAARHGHQTFLAVLMDGSSNNQIYSDAQHLLDFSFAHYQTQQILQKGAIQGYFAGEPNGEKIPVATNESLLVTTQKDTKVVPKLQIVWSGNRTHDLWVNAKVGHINVWVQGRKVAVEPVYLLKPYRAPRPTSPAVYTTLWITFLACGTFAIIFLKRKMFRRRTKLHHESA